MRTALLFIAITLTLSAPVRAQQHTILVSPRVGAFWKYLLDQNVFWIGCAMGTATPAGDTIRITTVVEPRVDNRRRSLDCPPAAIATVRTPGTSPCEWVEGERRVFAMRPERFRILLCRTGANVLSRGAAKRARTEA